MGDRGDFYNDLKEHKRTEREVYAAGADDRLAKLKEAGYEFREIGPVHHRIEFGKVKVDYWPTKNHYRNLHTGSTGHGVERLIKTLKVIKERHEYQERRKK